VLMNCQGWTRYFSAQEERYQEAYRDFSQMVSMLDNCVRKQ
jgi:hypothetical protein